jgi:putative flippase GtrA
MTILRHIQNIINGIINFFYPPFRRFIPIETFRYAATGGGNMVLDIVLYFLVFHFVLLEQNLNLGFVVISPHIAAFLIVFPITFTNGFLLAKYITFTQSSLHGKKQLFRYGLTVAGSILLNYVLLKIFVDKFHIYATPSKMLTTAVVVIYSFVAQKYFTFKTGKKQLSKEANLAD